MGELAQMPAPELKALELQRAFDVFTQASLALTQSYQGLQERVESLTAELAVANGELRRQYEEKEALSERLSLLLNALPAGVIVLDSVAEIREANPVARQMFGQAVLGQSWSAVVRDRLLPTEAPDEWHLDSRRVAIVESPLDSAGGRILLIHDVTAAHALKAELERNQRLAAMGEMAASLAHQLRTPLATALLYSSNLAQPGLGDEARKRFADKVAAQLRRLERLIQEVLLFARGESIGRAVIGGQQLLAEAVQTVEPLCHEKRIDFRTVGNVGKAVVIGNRKALVGALVNLLENAMQACSDGGRVTIDVAFSGPVLRIGIRDTGPGIEPAIRERVFEPFFTTRAQEGTGLGLAIALGVARAHGGTIEVRSTVGKGSEFALVLPAQAGNEDDRG